MLMWSSLAFHARGLDTASSSSRIEPGRRFCQGSCTKRSRGMEVLRMKSRKINSRVSALAAAYVWFGYLLLQPGWVFSQVPFYQGKTITVISGQEPGGTGDMRLKALLAYLKKHIPGQPNLLPEYMPGGGGRKAANYMYRTARADGLTLGFPPGGFIMFAVLGETGVNYDLDYFNFFRYV